MRKRLRQTLLLPLLLLSMGTSIAAAGTDCPPAASPAQSIRPAAPPRFAQLFDIEYRNGYKLLTIRLTPNDVQPRRYVLLPCGAVRPEVEGVSAYITTPVRSVVVLSNAYLPFLASTGAIGTVTGVNRLAHVSDPTVRAAAGRGAVIEVGQEATLDRERLLALQPDLVLSYGDGQLPAALQPLQSAGMAIIETAEYREPHPLGYAEWVKLFAAFFDAEARAESAFDQIASRYLDIRKRASQVARRPSVLVGGSYNGVWYVPTPRSYTAQLITDAGGRYAFDGLPWRRDSLDTMLPIDLETALASGRTAELWIDTLTWRSRAEALAADPRYALFDACRSGNMYNNDARTNADGANVFWEQGLARPDTVLMDLFILLHPELADGAGLQWYRQLPEHAP
jgi:iron complex transport system substrate-binding protein